MKVKDSPDKMQSQFKSLKKNTRLPAIACPSELAALMKKAIQKASSAASSTNFKFKLSDFRRLAYESFSKAILSGQIKEIKFNTTIHL